MWGKSSATRGALAVEYCNSYKPQVSSNHCVSYSQIKMDWFEEQVK